MPEAEVPELSIGGRTFVLLPKEEYERLARAQSSPAPSLHREVLGRDLRARRHAAGLTQAELAGRAGIRLETLSRIENGHGNPTMATLRSILGALEARGR